MDQDIKLMLAQFDRPIAFHRCLVKVAGSITAALFLSQALYWTPRSTLGNGWFYKTQEEWEEETGLTRTEQETARKRLRGLCLIEEKLEGLPAKLHYRVNLEKIQASLIAENQPSSMRETCEPVCGKPANLIAETLHTFNTEITTENTTEISSPKNESSLSLKPQNYPLPVMKLSLLEKELRSIASIGLGKVDIRNLYSKELKELLKLHDGNVIIGWFKAWVADHAGFRGDYPISSFCKSGYLQYARQDQIQVEPVDSKDLQEALDEITAISDTKVSLKGNSSQVSRLLIQYGKGDYIEAFRNFYSGLDDFERKFAKRTWLDEGEQLIRYLQSRRAAEEINRKNYSELVSMSENFTSKKIEEQMRRDAEQKALDDLDTL